MSVLPEAETRVCRECRHPDIHDNLGCAARMGQDGMDSCVCSVRNWAPHAVPPSTQEPTPEPLCLWDGWHRGQCPPCRQPRSHWRHRENAPDGHPFTLDPPATPAVPEQSGEKCTCRDILKPVETCPHHGGDYVRWAWLKRLDEEVSRIAYEREMGAFLRIIDRWVTVGAMAGPGSYVPSSQLGKSLSECAAEYLAACNLPAVAISFDSYGAESFASAVESAVGRLVELDGRELTHLRALMSQEGLEGLADDITARFIPRTPPSGTAFQEFDTFGRARHHVLADLTEHFRGEAQGGGK